MREGGCGDSESVPARPHPVTDWSKLRNDSSDWSDTGTKKWEPEIGKHDNVEDSKPGNVDAWEEKRSGSKNREVKDATRTKPSWSAFNPPPAAAPPSASHSQHKDNWGTADATEEDLK